MANAKPSIPTASAMMNDVLYPDDGMPIGGRRVGALKKNHFTKMEGKAYTFFETRDKAPEKSKKALAAEAAAEAEAQALLGASQSEPTFRPRHFLQRGFGLGDRVDIVKCFGASLDGMGGPGRYDTHEVGQIRWDKSEGNSHPAQMTISNHKSCKLASFGKPKTLTGPGQPPLCQEPGPGHYAMSDFWDPNWQRYPSCGKSFCRKLPPSAESRFGGLARQEMKNAKEGMSFIQ